MANLKEALQKASEAGTSIAFIAKNIGRDTSTVHKWMRGTSKYLSQETEESLLAELRRLRDIWNSMDI